MDLRVRIILLLLLTFSLLTACKPNKDSSAERGLGEGPRVGYRAPNFRLKNLEGKEISLASFKGKVVFLNFWATWCVPCKIEMPSMEALYQEYKEDGLEILAVSNDLQGESVVQPFVDETGLTYPILMDENFRINAKYLVRSIPTSILIGRDGVITHTLIGARDWHAPEARDLIRQLLNVRI